MVKTQGGDAPANRGKVGNLKLVREKSGKLGKVREIMVCPWCSITVVVVGK